MPKRRRSSSRIADQDGHDVALRRHDWQSCLEQAPSHRGGALLMAVAFDLARPEVTDTGKGAGGESRRQSSLSLDRACEKSGSQWTRRWREMDSNHRSPVDTLGDTDNFR